MKNIAVLLLLNLTGFSQEQTAELINGVFVLNQISYYDSLNITQAGIINGVAAYFTDVPLAVISTGDYQGAGNVQFNAIPLTFSEGEKYYWKTGVENFNRKNWKVSGYSSIPTMNFLYTGTLPSFSVSRNLWADTIKKSDTLFIQLDNIQFTDSITIKISDGSEGSGQHHIALLAPNYSNTYYLPPAIFAPLNTGPKATITIDAINYNYQTVAGKRFLFRNIFSVIGANVKIIN